MLLEDGTGSGRTARITIENRVATDSISIGMPHHVNQYHGLSFSLFINETPSGADPSIDTSVGCFFYFKNTSDIEISILTTKAWVESNEYIDLYINDSGTPIGGNTVTPINMNLGSGKTASGTFLSGTNITGLTKGVFLNRLRIPADNEEHFSNFISHLLLPKNTILTGYGGSGGIPIEFRIEFYYHGPI